jgi:ABC transporter substrate binding protein (PQQ-dependent alcohol dehydrogenase system)
MPKLGFSLLLLPLVLSGFLFPSGALATEPDPLRIGYLQQERDLPPALSNLDERPVDEGVAGARLGIEDNNATGKFTGQKFTLEVHTAALDQDPAAVLQQMTDSGLRLILLDLTSEALERVLAGDAVNELLLFNVATQDRRFRDDVCHGRLLHTALSRQMRTDALAQFLVFKRWKEWFLVFGPRPEDAAFAEAVRYSARKFGAKIVEERSWTGEFDARRNAQAEVPLFTDDVDYDVLVVADEIGDFGDYLIFQTRDPRPVAGTQGLVAQTWGRPVEQWGAAQLQERFVDLSGRWMLPRDYAAWVAVRAIGEGALRSKSLERESIETYIRSEKFKMAGFKGRKMSFRDWNGQMRQPVPLIWPRAVVAMPPLDGFLHQHFELDTLGLDRPESRCK